MKYSKTALMYLSHEYSHILKKCALLNAALLIGTMLSLPASAEEGKINALHYDENGAIKQEATQSGTIKYEEDGDNLQITADGWKDANADSVYSDGIASYAADKDKRKTNIHNSRFTNNNSLALVLWHEGDSTEAKEIKVVDSYFENNVMNPASKKGGAVAVLANWWVNKGKEGKTTFERDIFKHNQASGNGGAIYAEHSFVNIADSTFDGNTAANGGAFYLERRTETCGDATLTVTGTTFTGNKASEKGGAIYNKGGNLTITNTTFSGNTAKEGGDIYSEGGSIKFTGDITLDNGIGGSGDITFAKGASLTATLQATTILAKSVTFEGENTINLQIKNGFVNDSEHYDFITFSGDNASKTVTNKDNVTLFNPVYDLALNDDGTVTVKGVLSADQIVQKLDVAVSEEEAGTIGALLESNNHGTDLGNQVTDAISTALQNGHQAEAVQAVQELAPTTSQQVMGVTQSVNELLTNVTGTRMSALGKAGGDAFVGGSVWVQGLYNHSEQDASAGSAGFDADTEGIAFGVDGKANDAITIGAGYGYTKTNANSDGRKIDVDGHNFFVYGQYKPEKFYINTLLNYGFSKYTEKKSPMGIIMKSKYDVNSFAANLMTGYDFDNGITPEAGLRYVLADQESYNDGAQNVSTDKNDVLTAIMGVKYTANVKANEWKLAPSVRLAATYDLMSDNSKANVNVIGGGNYQITGERLHRFGVEAGAGVTATLRNVDLTLDYNGGFRKDFQSHTGMLKATYHF